MKAHYMTRFITDQHVIVYKHTCTVTNKAYIGTTVLTIDHRFYKHCWEANNHKRINSKFHRAIRKYGVLCWDSQVLYVCSDPEEGYRAERELIATYDTFNTGYNTTLGGVGGPILHGASNGMWGKTHTAEVRARLAASARERYTGKTYEQRHGTELASTLRQKRSEDMTRIRQSRSGVGAANPNFNPEVLTFQHTLGLEFTGTRQDFHITHGVPRSQISNLLSGVQKSAKGWTVTLVP